MSGKYYSSPRWTGEILDCSMPMTFDTYSECSYRCLYCFSFFQKSIGAASKNYLHTKARPVNAGAIKRMFAEPESSQFGDYIRNRVAMQWGGLADQFDENEREQGITLELLKYFRKIKYPISFSTKAVWWSQDERYVKEFIGAKHFNLKVSIITRDDRKAEKMEILVPSPTERLELIRRASSWGIGGVTLRLRPFILGLTDLTYEQLINDAADAGATAVSTEFLCLEGRSVNKAKNRYEAMSKIVGFDLFQFYKDNSYKKSGYLRLNREIKRKYIMKMKEICDRRGLRLYVSDAHFKEVSCNGSCCGLDTSWNYSRGQFTEALVVAKREGRVKWSDIEGGLEYAKNIPYNKADGFNTGSGELRAKFHSFSLKDYIRFKWNDVNGSQSPYKYFGGILMPDGHDEEGNVIYKYTGEK